MTSYFGAITSKKLQSVIDSFSPEFSRSMSKLLFASKYAETEHNHIAVSYVGLHHEVIDRDAENNPIWAYFEAFHVTIRKVTLHQTTYKHFYVHSEAELKSLLAEYGLNLRNLVF